MRNTIPPITEPMGRSWRQPSPAGILLDDTHALMTPQDFRSLPEYSGSTPSGVYPGKMWRRHDGAHDPRCKPEDREWLLCWFGEVEGRPDLCSNNYRKILLTEGAPA